MSQPSAYALTHAAIFEMIRLNSGATMRHDRTGLDLAREHGFKLWTVMLPDIIAWARAYKGRTLADWEQVRDGLAGIHAQGITTFNDSISRSWLGRGLADADRLDEGLGIVDQAIAESERSGIRWFEAESYRVRGEILVRRDPANHGAGRGSVPHCHRHRAAAESQELRVARRVVVGEALSIDQSRRRRPRRTCTRARRFFADAGVARDRGSTTAPWLSGLVKDGAAWMSAKHPSRHEITIRL